MGKSQQDKGRRGEEELARILRARGYSIDRGRSLSYGTAPDLSGLPHIHIEVKRHEKMELYSWMSQSIRDAEKFGDGFPTVFHRRNNSDWLVTMRLDDFLDLYEMW